MKFQEPISKPRKHLAKELVMSSEEMESFDFKNTFTPKEWEELKQEAFGIIPFSFLFQAGIVTEEEMQSSEERLLEEGIAKINADAARLDKRTDSIWGNICSSLVHLSIVAGAYPKKRLALPRRDFVHQYIKLHPGEFFQKVAESRLGDYSAFAVHTAKLFIQTFPEDRTWVLDQLSQYISPEEVKRELDDLAQKKEWLAFLHFSGPVRLIYPNLSFSHHTAEIVSWLRQQRKPFGSNSLSQYILNFRLLTAGKVDINPDGELILEDMKRPVSKNKPLPERPGI